jgi:hypothetical protein
MPMNVTTDGIATFFEDIDFGADASHGAGEYRRDILRTLDFIRSPSQPTGKAVHHWITPWENPASPSGCCVLA